MLYEELNKRKKELGLDNGTALSAFWRPHRHDQQDSERRDPLPSL